MTVSFINPNCSDDRALLISKGVQSSQATLTGTNQINHFQRTPSDLRRYRQYIWNIQAEHGSVMNFILMHRLQWHDLTPKGAPFECPEDIKVSFNDWPYGIDTCIVHLVVWTKFELKDEPSTGFLTPASTSMVEEYVDRTFRSKMKAENVGFA